MPKKTQFSDSQTNATSVPAHAENSNWKQLDRKGKWQYIKDYYLLKAIILVLFLGFLGYVGFVTLGPKVESELYGMVLNDTLDQSGRANLINDFSKQVGVTGSRHTYTIDDSFSLSRSNPDYGTQQKISTYAYGAHLDVIIADEDTIKYVAECGYLMDLTQVLPSDLYQTVTNDLVFTKTEADDTERAYGVSLENSSIYKSISTNYISNNGKKMAIGLVGRSKKRDNAISLIRYLLNDK